ncbi:MAG: tRNA (N6-isopentenyl adenosine(37)-C2)-methylthiotransferase MiaB [Armatimonadetes bacterium]|nr:tRNA (N6-isopentenyl adenosine(37)-C2)-methylthiotransferase MiaB [Armatimonadota bacterium]MDE2206181.1 tRNA (N6-isopentenyl adenosine(37)-C2)-methylthiotransferase MiaB [Armatimonadota bacterium]
MTVSVDDVAAHSSLKLSSAAPRGRYAILTWGCQMNEEDSEQMSLFLEEMGYRRTDDTCCADVVLLNTCSVRSKPEEKVWSELGRLRGIKQQRPGMVIGVCGCMAQVESAEILRRAPHVDLVMGTGNLAILPTLIERAASGAAQQSLAPRAATIPLQLREHRAPVLRLDLPARRGAVVTDIPGRSTRRRPKLKAHVPIMYGCDKFCAFCIVPYTRGRERSRPTAEIVAEVEMLAQGGTREITLLGQTVNSYGKNLAEGRVPFAQLLGRLDSIPGIQRIRFTSPYPRDFRDDLIEAIGALPSVCEHVHLPLQVGDNELLADMGRGYTVERFLEIVEQLRAAAPGISITTDIMLGFPGETDQQFRNTLAVVEQVRFDSAFMFAYSQRPGTKAASREDQIPHRTRIDRLNTLIALQNAITVDVNQALAGRRFEVLVEGRSPKDPSRLTGLTRTNKTVNFDAPVDSPEADSLTGKLVTVEALEGHLWGFTGRLSD